VGAGQLQNVKTPPYNRRIAMQQRFVGSTLILFILLPAAQATEDNDLPLAPRSLWLQAICHL
jgi:hypothetical protein